MRLALYLVLPIVLFFLLAYAVLIFLTPQTPEAAPPEDNGTPECGAGETEDCITAKGCDGYRTCTEGRWSPCITLRECTPGDTEPCALNICTLGQRTCDECGQWGRCMPKESGG